MFLSRLVLNPRCHQVRREVAEPYQMHRTLLHAFPDGMDRQTERVLFRVDAGRETAALVVLVQSLSEPAWSRLEARPGYLLRCAECKEYRPAFRQKQRLFFRLRANPTVKREGKRQGLRTEQEQLEWLKRKGLAGGFEVCAVQLTREGVQQGRKTDDQGGHEMTHLAIRFDGLLEVTSPDLLTGALRAGIGSGKGFGFGLLSLAAGE